MWKGVTGSLGPWGGGGIVGMVVGSQWCSWAARVYRAAVMMWWACPSRRMWRSVPKSFGRWAVGWTVITEGESIAFSLYTLEQSRVQVLPGDGGKTFIHHAEHTPPSGFPDRRLTPQRHVDGLIS